jgi:hypothetical protein
MLIYLKEKIRSNKRFYANILYYWPFRIFQKKRGGTMIKLPNSEIIKNPFKMYRYEVIGAYRDFLFSHHSVPTRANMDDDGYDDVTDYDKFEDFSDEIKEHYLPFMLQITENEFIDNHDKALYDDFKVTQGWALNPSEMTVLFNKLKLQEKSIKKIEEKEFMDQVINREFKRENGSRVELEDVRSLDINFIFHYMRSFDAVEVNASDITFNRSDIVRVTKKEGDFDGGMYVPHDIYSYYFGLDHVNLKRELVTEVLQKEIIFSPALVFEAEFYLKLREKISAVGYDTSREK